MYVTLFFTQTSDNSSSGRRPAMDAVLMVITGMIKRKKK